MLANFEGAHSPLYAPDASTWRKHLTQAPDAGT
jgi:hypothetical protein